jgi:hypothetical protein
VPVETSLRYTAACCKGWDMVDTFQEQDDLFFYALIKCAPMGAAKMEKLLLFLCFRAAYTQGGAGVCFKAFRVDTFTTFKAVAVITGPDALKCCIYLQQV